MNARAPDMQSIIRAETIRADDNEKAKSAVSCTISSNDRFFILGEQTGMLCRYLRILAGVEPPHQGYVKLFGIKVSEMSRQVWHQQRQSIGFVARHAPLLSVLSGLQNVMLPALYHHLMDREEAHRRALELANEIGFSGDMQLLPAYLNRLQRTQLAIARTLILDPPIIFLETPFAGLSLAEQGTIQHYLSDWGQHRAIVAATHNLNLVKHCATQILFIAPQQNFLFSNWQEFIDSPEAAVNDYLARHHQHYQVI